MIQLSNPYMMPGKTVALTVWALCQQNEVSAFYYAIMLSRFVTAFLPRSKGLLILWLQSQSTVILEPRKILFPFFTPSICHEVMGPDASGVPPALPMMSSLNSTATRKSVFQTMG